MSVSAPVEETRASPAPGTPKPRHWWLTRSRQVTLGAVLIGLFSGLAALELERLDRVRRNNWTENLSRVAYDAAQRYRAPDSFDKRLLARFARGWHQKQDEQSH